MTDATTPEATADGLQTGAPNHDSASHASDVADLDQLLRSLANDSPLMFLAIRNDGTLAFISGAMERILGASAAQRLNTQVLDWIHPEDHERAILQMAATANQGGRRASLGSGSAMRTARGEVSSSLGRASVTGSTTTSGCFALISINSDTGAGRGGLGRVSRPAGRTRSVSSLYANQLSAETASDLGIRLGDAHAATLELLLDSANPAAAASVSAELFTGITSDIDAGIATVRVNSVDSRSELASIAVIENGWTTLQNLRANGGLSGDSPAAAATKVGRVEAIFDPMTAAAKSIVHVEASQAGASYQQALASYRSSLQMMLIVLVLGLVTAGGMVVWLIRSVLTRTLAYSAFATTVTEGDFTQRLKPRGSDELDQLGITLDELAQRRRSDDDYENAKDEFTDAMQLTENEQEAHDLLKRYLEHAVSACTATVLNRNNSVDRLEAVTALSEGSPLLRTLEGAEPRSCLAVRLARPHAGVWGSVPLLPCTVCSTSPGHTTCTPLLVSGEVIGSVLVEHESGPGRQ